MKAYADAQQNFLDELEEDEVELTVEAIQEFINEVNAKEEEKEQKQKLKKKPQKQL